MNYGSRDFEDCFGINSINVISGDGEMEELI